MTEWFWTPERLVSYPLITDLDIVADSQQVVYAVRGPLLTADESKFVTHLYRVSPSDREPVRLTYGPSSNSSPRWSPDGRHIAFLSDRGGKRNLYAMRPDGGEAWRLTDVEKDVTSLRWSPDGARIAFAMASPDSEERKTAKKAKNDPVRWGIDYDRARLWSIPFVQGGEPLPELRAVSPEDVHVVGFDWCSDGQRLAVLYWPTPCEDVWTEARLGMVNLADSEPALRDLGAVRSPQGTCPCRGEEIACVVGAEPASWAFDERVTVFSASDGSRRVLAPTPDARPYLIGWSRDGSEVQVLENSGTSSAILALSADGSRMRTVLAGRGYVSLAKSDGRGAYALVGQDSDQPNAVYVARDGEDAWQVLAQPCADAWPSGPLPRTEIVSWMGQGDLEIEALVTYPTQYNPAVRYPTLVIVHGGPMSVFSRTYVAAPGLYPIAAFAERGYVILRVNPRGSGGYGAGFRRANRADWGGGDYRDIMAGVDLLIERGIADPERLGIMGWSYGGYMTSWTITQTNRFRAASVGAGVTDLVSMTGTSDISGFLPDYNGCEFWEDLGAYRRQSPIHQVQGVTTPTLIQHGEKDVRVPLGQGLELYNALKRQGVLVEMDIYPRQGHGPEEPRLIMDIMRRNLEWFDRWLRPS